MQWATCMTFLTSHRMRRFNVINENEFLIEVKDDNMLSDDFIGRGTGSLVKARTAKHDIIQVRARLPLRACLQLWMAK